MSNMPYEQEDVEEMLLETAIRLNLKQKNGEPYTILSDAKGLIKGFMRRCKREGLLFIPQSGRGLSKQRWFSASHETLNDYRDNVIRPALKSFQDEHGALTLKDLGNFDEASSVPMPMPMPMLTFMFACQGRARPLRLC